MKASAVGARILTGVERRSGRVATSGRRRKGPVGKAFLYKPTRRPGSTYRRVVADVVQRVFGGDGVSLVASLFESHDMQPEQVEELQKLLDGLRKRQRKNKNKKR